MSAKKAPSPLKYVGKRGRAYIEVLALKDEIEEWLSKGFMLTSIYQMYYDLKKISNSYTYDTFRRAVFKALPKQKHEQRHSDFVADKNVNSKTRQRVFTPATGNFVKGDTED